MSLQAEPLNLKEATVTCIPRLRGGGGGRRSRRGSAAATQVSMLDRVRDVVLRLAMLSAASTATTTTNKGAPGTLRRAATSAAATPSRAAARVSPATSVAYTDSYRSEAVDDCIEFLKRSAAGSGGAPATAVEATSTAASPLHAAAACMCHVNQN
ncbi:hypothetical protein SEVIR_7G043100v4 [Setaria viridis]|uniref:Uncharacterized protein n=1 Tax=Setaria viridis TaxID=4556 RepID=A0A4U6TNU4_SETVI|nr:hypothetical protein SEVIR_7G043100v2 [Setaria viridis]